MAALINLQFLKNIFFNDETLLPELIEEWELDTNQRISSLKAKMENEPGRLFKELHELKTSFSMLAFTEGIIFVENLLKQLEQGKKLSFEAIFELEALQTALVEELHTFRPSL